MLGTTFYHDTIRKYVIVFGTLFNDIVINRLNESNQTVQTIKVPIAYGPKQKFLARLTQDPNLDKPVAIQLPRLAFELIDINYAPDRKLQTVNKVVAIDNSDENKLNYQFVPVPYDFSFNLYAMVKNAEDGTRILEQILPFFTPEWSSTVDLLPALGWTMDIPVVLNSVSMQDIYEGDFIERRSLIWNLSFLLKGYIFGPIKNTGIIKRSKTNVYVTNQTDIDNAIGNTQISETITTIPTLAGVALDDIKATDDYGFSTTIERYHGFTVKPGSSSALTTGQSPLLVGTTMIPDVNNVLITGRTPIMFIG